MTIPQPAERDALPECGIDQCDECGACLACEPDVACPEQPGYDEDNLLAGPAHVWADEDRAAAADRAREVRQ